MEIPRYTRDDRYHRSLHSQKNQNQTKIKLHYPLAQQNNPPLLPPQTQKIPQIDQ